ncbi:hypothetical protein CK219_17995 [Mesorhizobium sp. WSM4313]|nr:hypothetical protein CK219_17995 [Mesorhizobium sp. WSM4313]
MLSPPTFALQSHLAAQPPLRLGASRRSTSPPLCGGEETPIAIAAPFAILGSSPPPEAGERWLGEAETERGSAVGNFSPPWSNRLRRLALIQIKLAPVAGLIG